MKNNPDSTTDIDEPRRRAQHHPNSWPPEYALSGTDDDVRRLLHELQVYQLELEMENEGLRASQMCVEAESAHFADFYDYAPSGFLSLNQNGEITRINLAGARMLNRERARLVGKQLESFVDIPDRHAIQACLQQIFADGTRQSCEFALTEERWPLYVRIEAGLSFDKRECHVVMVDITVQKQMQNHLISVQDELQSTLDAMPDLLFEVGLDGRCYNFRSPHADLLMAPPDIFIGKRISDILPPEVSATCMTALQKANKNEFSMGHQFCLTINQVQKWFEMSISRKSGIYADGPRFLVISRNITERKKIEDSLREHQHQLQLFIEHAPAGIAMLDAEMRYLAVSQRFLDDYRITDTDVIGRSHYEIVPDIPDRWRDSHQRGLAGESRCCEIDSFSRADGSVMWAQLEVKPWIAASGKVGGIILFSEDITERVQFEQELVLSNHQLAHEVAMRTADLSALTAHVQNISEIEKASLARELHDELGSTLSCLSIEIGRLKEKVTDPGLLQGVSSIKDLISHAAKIKRQVVEQLYPTILDTCGLVAALKWQLNEFQKHTGMATELVIHEEIEAEHTYALATYRIVQECLTNVIKHAEASKIVLEVKTCDGFLDITLHDNGKGLPDAINAGSHGIFGMIERARFLGGSMNILSEEGKGTTALLHLPLSAAKPKDKKRVLLVDDHAIVRDALRNLLENHSDDFLVGGEAIDGEEAVQMAISEEWNIVLLDISLPKKNGLQALEEIKAAKPNLAIIILSSHPESEYAEMAISKGAFCYINKVETDQLIGAMRRSLVLQQSGRHRSSAGD